MTLSSTTRLCRNENILSSEVNGDTVMMSVQNGKYYGVNPTGNYIWKALEQPLDVETLIRQITNAFQLSSSICREEVMPFLEEMVEEHILIIQE